MNIRFETNNRYMALRHLRGFYPDSKFSGTEKPVSDFLDLVEEGMFRVPDPMMHPNGAVMPGENFSAEHQERVTNIAHAMHEFLLSTEEAPNA